MYQVLLVDDEHNFCMYLKSLLDWESLGCCIPMVAYSGQEALSELGSRQIDIVFTDMNMPGMDGAELIKRSRERGDGPVFIALSGFEDFAYVRESLKNGALDYILKHNLSENVMREVLQSAMKKATGRCSAEEEIPASYKGQMACEIYKELLLQGCRDKKAVGEALENLDCLLTQEGCLLMLLQINDYGILSSQWTEERQKQRFLHMVLDICRNALADHARGVAFPVDANSFALIFGMDGKVSRLYMLETVRQLSGRIASGIRKMLNASPRFAVGDVCYDIEGLNEAYLQTTAKFIARFYSEGEGIFMKKPLPFAENAVSRVEEQEMKKLVFLQDKEGIHERLALLFRGYKEKNVKPSVVKEEMITLCSLAGAMAKNSHVSPEELTERGMSCYTQLQFCETAGQMKEVAVRLFCTLLDRIQAQKYRENYSDVTQKALTYIGRHYCDSISLDEVSAHIGINSAYLSRIFKRDVEKGFVEFLNEYRIEKARELITQDVRLKEIVSRTGFSSYNYFFKVFKEITHMTPQEYKKDIQEGMREGKGDK